MGGKQKFSLSLLLYRIIWSLILVGFVTLFLFIGVIIGCVLISLLGYIALGDTGAFSSIFTLSSILHMLKFCAGVGLSFVVLIYAVVCFAEV